MAEGPSERRCIVTRAHGARDELIRFVRTPDGQVVPDLRCRLPGRGVWVTGQRGCVEAAVRGRLFAKGFKAPAQAAPDLPDTVERLLREAALGALGMSRKAGQVVTGQTKVEALIRKAPAAAVLHAADGAEDGLRKLRGAVRASAVNSGAEIVREFTIAELSLALGRTNVIHAALPAGRMGSVVVDKVMMLRRYRGHDTQGGGENNGPHSRQQTGSRTFEQNE